ncbi:MAG: hypothetical protein LBC19_01860 [Tannerella sp.]|jgi:hypothetical protein|nr:hypothetical protein [Tannerella sp.]
MDNEDGTFRIELDKLVKFRMSGTVRLYVDNTGEKYGTLELTSLEPSGAREPANLQSGIYTETFIFNTGEH